MTEKMPTPPMSLSDIQAEIENFNAEAKEFKDRRDIVVRDIESAGLGKRFAQRSLASVTVKMPEGK